MIFMPWDSDGACHKETEGMSRYLSSGGATFTLPKQCIKMYLSCPILCVNECQRIVPELLSSKPEFEIVPLGVVEATSLSMMSCGHYLRCHTSGWFSHPSRGTKCSAGNHTPPAPAIQTWHDDPRRKRAGAPA